MPHGNDATYFAMLGLSKLRNWLSPPDKDECDADSEKAEQGEQSENQSETPVMTTETITIGTEEERD
jgi:hypothetical protein